MYTARIRYHTYAMLPCVISITMRGKKRTEGSWAKPAQRPNDVRLAICTKRAAAKTVKRPISRAIIGTENNSPFSFQMYGRYRRNSLTSHFPLPSLLLHGLNTSKGGNGRRFFPCRALDTHATRRQTIAPGTSGYTRSGWINSNDDHLINIAIVVGDRKKGNTKKKNPQIKDIALLCTNTIPSDYRREHKIWLNTHWRLVSSNGINCTRQRACFK